MINSENFEEAVVLLKLRLDCADDRMITMFYSNPSRIPFCTRKASDKQKTLDDYERVFRRLETAGESFDADHSLVCQLLGKFPSGMVRDLHQFYRLNPTTL